MTIVLVVLLSDGMNALQIYLFGAFYFWVPLTFVALVLLGLVLAFLPPPVFPLRNVKTAAMVKEVTF